MLAQESRKGGDMKGLPEEKELFHQDPLNFIRDFIAALVRESPENRFAGIDGSPIFGEPLVGFTRGDAPLFAEYKKIIGPFHLTPQEVLEQNTERPWRWEGLSVICWVLPIVPDTRKSNAARRKYPSMKWAHTRAFGEEFNNKVRREVAGLLNRLGYPAVAPVLTPSFRMLERPEGLTSTWSERHALYAAGLGTFSLSDGFITPRGIAHRCGTVIAAVDLPSTGEVYPHHLANCLFFKDGSCGVCVRRCPCGAITEKGHDKVRCRQYLLETRAALASAYKVTGEVGCGLCQTRVPCESRIPLKAGGAHAGSG